MQLIGKLLAAAVAKDEILFIRHVGRNEISHVLDKSEYRDPDLIVPEHVGRLTHIGDRNFLGRAHHNSTGKRETLDQRQGNIACARGQVDDHIIKSSPLNVGKQLLQCS